MGTRWRVLRRILNENVFSTRALDNFTPLRKQKVHGLLKQLYSASSSKNPVNIGEWVFITVANITSNLTCSKSLFEYTTKEGREMKESLRELIKLLGTGNVADFFPLFKPFDPQGLKRRTLEIFWKYDASYEKLIDERLTEREIGINNNTKKEKGDMLDALLNYRSDKDDDLRTLSRNMIKSLLSDIFIASTETSTSTAEWGMAEILKNPDVHKKIVLELDQVVGKDRGHSQSSALYSFHFYVLLYWESLVWMITGSLVGRLRCRSYRNCHSYDLLLAVLPSPKPIGWVGTSSVFPHAGCREECCRVLVSGHEVKLSLMRRTDIEIPDSSPQVHQLLEEGRRS
ncbi:hypothetical protein ACFX2I_047273 [Malus domestica]